MSYNISSLLTVEECDNMLEIAQSYRADVEYRKTSQERRRDSYSERSSQVVADLTAVNTEIASLEALIPTLPEGQVKEDLENRKTRLEYRKFLLVERSENYGTLALLDLQLNIAMSGQQLTEIDSFIAQVAAHRATL